MLKKGCFITFEGPDGAGKTTQVQRIAQRLAELGYPVIQTREPGGTSIGNKIRAILLDPAHVEMHPFTEVLLYAASRAQHVQEVIKPALAEGKLVLCDRFVDASMAYQAAGLGVDSRWVEEVNRFATSNLVPDRTYLLDLPPWLGRERINARQSGLMDRIERKRLDYHERVRNHFLSLAGQFPERIRLVDAGQGIAEVTEAIWRDLSQLLAVGT